MTNQPEPLSLGRYLQLLRVKKGLGLDEVSRRTHISRQNLIRIETDDYAALPASVHVKGFLRVYAQLLQLDPERVLQRYTEELMVWKNPSAAHGLSGRLDFWPRFIFAICVLAGVIALTLFSVSSWNRPAPMESTIAGNGGKKSSLTRAAGQNDGVHPGNTLMSADKVSESDETINEKLRVVTLEPTKLKAIIDGQAPETYHLKPEEQLELEAQSNFNLLLDNAQGVELFFNEKPIRLSGKSGQNVTIQLP